MTPEGDRLRGRLDEARLYLVTPGVAHLDDLLGRVLDAGVDIVQLREKAMEAKPLLALAGVVRRRTEEFGALFIVNDRVDMALAAGADGVHLGQQDLTPAEARRQMGPDALVGLSTHDQEEVVAASATAGTDRPDYIGVGPVYATPTKPGRPAVGLGLVSFAAGSATLPFFAIGGIGPANAAAVVAAGASRLAVVRALTEAEDPAAAAMLLRAKL